MLNRGHDQQLANTCVATVVAVVAASGFQFYTHGPFTFFLCVFHALLTVHHISFPGLNRQFSRWANSRACASLKKMVENICKVVAEYEKRLQGMAFFPKSSYGPFIL
jgi:hypothetical protein